MKLQNKILIISIFLLLFLLFFNIGNVFAFTFTDINNNELTLSDIPDTIEYDYIISVYNGRYTIFSSNSSDGYFYVTGERIKCTSTTVSRYALSDDGVWNRVQTNISGNGSNSDYMLLSCFVYSNSTVYTDIDKTDVFFQVPVQEVEVVVPALEKVEELPKAIVETLKVIIPVGLVLLGIILLIYLIKRVIYLSQ